MQDRPRKPLIPEDCPAEGWLSLLSGGSFMTSAALPEGDIPSVEMSDGPIGLRYQSADKDSLGLHASERATALLSGPSLAATWNPQIASQMGEIIGREAADYGVDLVLGPAVNLVRNPMCGRNAEYYSEDPLLAGLMASGYIEGAQSQGVGCCIKHFACNNQETEREYLDVVCDETTLRELYLKAFEIPVRQAKPAAVMTALNRLNGVYCAENPWLLRHVLREEWGYQGVTLTDWNGLDDRAGAVEAGLNLEMPATQGRSVDILKEAMASGRLDAGTARERAEETARWAKALHRVRERHTPPFEAHHEAVRKAASESVILLQNHRNCLPLRTGTKIAVIGAYGDSALFQAEGSGRVNAAFADSPLEEIRALNGETLTGFAMGYEKGGTAEPEQEDNYLREAVRLATEAETVIFFLGMDGSLEGEGHDRPDYCFPAGQTRVLEAVAAVNPSVVVVAAHGGAAAMPFADRVDAILGCFLGGQGIGWAVAQILFGRVNPSGHLPVSVPAREEQIISWENFAPHAEQVVYHEGVWMGYRGYHTKGIPVQWPFGHGLSYTDFAIRDMKVSRAEMEDTDTVTLTVIIANTGVLPGAQVVQLYVDNCPAFRRRPLRELRAFQKVFLEPGEERTLTFMMDRTWFACFDERIGSWSVPEGTYEIVCGFSVEDVRKTMSLRVHVSHPVPARITGWDRMERLLETESGRRAFEEMLREIEAHASGFLLEYLKGKDMRVSILQVPIRVAHILIWSYMTDSEVLDLLERCNQELYAEYTRRKGVEHGC